MNTICAKCGGPIGRQIGPGGRRKYCPGCSPKRERQRSSRTARGHPSATPPQPTGQAAGVLEAVTAELQAADVLDTVPGVLARLLAARIDAGDETASGLCTLVKTMGDVLADARRRAEDKRSADDPLQRIRRNRLGIVD